MPSFLTRLAAAWILTLTTVSCASSGMFQLSADEQAALRLAMDTPLTFVVPRDQSIGAWDRAREFVDRYSSMKLRSITDSVLLTYEPPTYPSDPSPVEPGSGIRYGYSVSRSPDPNGILIDVQCMSSSKLGENDAAQNAHIAAYYIRTGRIVCDRCIVR